jgi:hypothetical protein
MRKKSAWVMCIGGVWMGNVKVTAWRRHGAPRRLRRHIAHLPGVT